MRLFYAPLILIGFLAPGAAAQCSGVTGTGITVSFSPSTGGTCAIAFDSGSGKYNVTINRNAATTLTVTANIRTSVTNNLHNVTVNTNNALWSTWLSVGTDSNRFSTIDHVSKTGTGTVVLLDLYTSGHLGVNLS